MKILIIDDEPLVRKSLRRLFESQGHQILESEDGKTGLATWLEHNPDLVFLDILMPVMNGPEVLEKIGTHKGQTKVILISAYSGEFDLQTTQRLGANLFLAKPFEDIFSVGKIVKELFL